MEGQQEMDKKAAEFRDDAPEQTKVKTTESVVVETTSKELQQEAIDVELNSLYKSIRVKLLRKINIVLEMVEEKAYTKLETYVDIYKTILPKD